MKTTVVTISMAMGLSLAAATRLHAQPCNFTGPYEMQHWSSSGIDLGTTTITPDSGPTESASFAYDVSPLFGPVSFRTATFSARAAATGTINFDWDYTWVHTGSSSTAQLSVFADIPWGGRTTILLADETGPAGGSATIDVEEGSAFGFIVGGSSSDFFGPIQGTATITHLYNAGDDCNGNAVPDNCDIAAGTSDDLNGNGDPDECETVHNITQGTTHSRIQRAIETAVGADVIEVGPRDYVERINLLGKAITLRSTGGPDVTIIDGDAGGSVITCSNSEGPGTVIEGFTVTNGTGTEVAWDTRGGGMFNFGSSPTVTNCIFRGNSAILGGGMYNEQGTPTVTNCTFRGNSAAKPGQGGTGGGMYNGVLGSPTVTNCVFSGNSANNRGGGMHTVYASYPVLINCTFSGNSAGRWGGAVASDGSPTLTNCILWGNTAPFGGRQVYGSATIDYSDFQGGWPGTGNIDSDPSFVRNPSDGGDGWGDDPNTPDVDESANNDYGDLHLQVGSPCINAGDNYALPDHVTTDIDGEARIQQCRVDMGADETPHSGALIDCDTNGIPDECDIAAGTLQDCNRNGIPDTCDLAAGTSDDCNVSAVPDECESGGLYDCNANGTSDWCDVQSGTSQDLNTNGVPDECDSIHNLTQNIYHLTIQGAIVSAVGGDVIELEPGRYVERIDLLGKAITLRSTGGPDTTIIDGAAGGSVITCNSGEGPGTVIEGFTVTNGSAHNGGGIYIYYSSPTLRNCAFTRNYSAQAGGGVFNGGGSPTLTHCTFRGNQQAGMANTEGSPILINCAFFELGDALRNSSSFPRLINCTLCAGGYALRNSRAYPTLTNCIVWRGAPPVFYDHQSTTRASFSCVTGGWPGPGNIDADPLFVNADDDVRLKAGSPCIDAGVSMGLAEDLDGHQRIVDDPYTVDTGVGFPAVIDMGAYEYGSAPQRPGDLDGDGDIDLDDFAILQAGFGGIP